MVHSLCLLCGESDADRCHPLHDDNATLSTRNAVQPEWAIHNRNLSRSIVLAPIQIVGTVYSGSEVVSYVPAMIDFVTAFT